MKIYKNKLNTDTKLMYASGSLLLGIIIIDWLVPKTYNEKFTQHNNKK